MGQVEQRQGLACLGRSLAFLLDHREPGVGGYQTLPPRASGDLVFFHRVPMSPSTALLPPGSSPNLYRGGNWKLHEEPTI